MVKCKVTEVIPLSKTKENPILVHFENGNVQPEQIDQFECLLAHSANEDKQLHAIAAHADNVYTGAVGQGFAGDLMRNFVGIRNTVTNKIRLIEVEQCSLLGKHYLPDPTALRTAIDKEAAMRVLLKSFGGKVANRLLERKEKMRLNVDVVKENLNKTVNETTALKLNATNGAGDDDEEAKDAFDVAQTEREDALKSMVPQLNEQAKRLEDVYRLTDLIDEGLLRAMDEDALAVLQTDISDLPIKAAFLLAIIKQCQAAQQPESAQNLTRIKVCIYIDGLINFLKGVRNSKQNMKVQNFSDIAERVETDIRKKFRQPDTQMIIKTNYIQHKVICYVVILSLIASDKFEIDASHLVDAINTSKTQLFLLTSIVAVRRKAKTDMLTLKLPSQLRTNRKPFVRSSRRTL